MASLVPPVWGSSSLTITGIIQDMKVKQEKATGTVPHPVVVVAWSLLPADHRTCRVYVERPNYGLGTKS